MAFCLPHRVSLVLAVEGIPVYWQSVKSPKPSGSCPLCRAHKEGEKQFDAAVKKWVERGRKDPSFLMTDAKDSDNSADKDNDNMNFESQQKNKARLREENNRKITAELKRSSIPGNNKRSREEVPAKKPNHLRLIKE
jgi:hypothetical protein